MAQMAPPNGVVTIFSLVFIIESCRDCSPVCNVHIMFLNCYITLVICRVREHDRGRVCSSLSLPKHQVTHCLGNLNALYVGGDDL